MGSRFSQDRILEIVKAYLESSQIDKEKDSIQNILGINDLNVSIDFEKKDITRDYKLATIGNSYNLEEELKIVFFVESLASKIDNSYHYEEYAKEDYIPICETVIQFILFHELVHFRQIKDGMTREKYQLANKNYKNNIYEIEANDKAYKYITLKGIYEKNIIDNFLRDKTICSFY